MPKDAKQRVEQFGGAIEAGGGENLVAFCLYGPAVRRDLPEAERDLTTLIILRDVSPAALRPIERPVNEWTRAGNPPPLIFSDAGWRSATDVFPIEIEDMREAHLLVKGAPPFEGLRTTKDDLRRQLEREVRGKLMRLRSEFVAAATDGKALGELLADSVGTFFVLFRAVLRLVGRTPPQDRVELVQQTAEAVGLDVEAFEWVLARVAGKKVRKLEAYDAIGDRYVEQIERLASFVDSWEAGAGTGGQERAEG